MQAYSTIGRRRGADRQSHDIYGVLLLDAKGQIRGEYGGFTSIELLPLDKDECGQSMYISSSEAARRGEEREALLRFFA